MLSHCSKHVRERVLKTILEIREKQPYEETCQTLKLSQIIFDVADYSEMNYWHTNPRNHHYESLNIGETITSY